MAESGVTVALISFGSSFFSAFIVLLGDRYVARVQSRAAVRGAEIGAHASVRNADTEALASVTTAAIETSPSLMEEFRRVNDEVSGFLSKLDDIRGQLDPLTRGILPHDWQPLVPQVPVRLRSWVQYLSAPSLRILPGEIRRDATPIDEAVRFQLQQPAGEVPEPLQRAAAELTDKTERLTRLYEDEIKRGMEGGWQAAVLIPGQAGQIGT
ncbi:hypothetical protein [Streptomyces spinosirectus]